MRSRWPVAVGVVLLGVIAVGAQPIPRPALPPIPTAPPGAGQLPPLLPPPLTTPLPEVPRPGTGPRVEYDPGYLYLPEKAPERTRRRAEECGPDGRWWTELAFGLSWVPTNQPPANVRLRVPDPASLFGTVPGPVLPVAGLSSGRLDAALGLVLGRWFGETNTEGVEASFYFRNAENTFGVTSPGVLVLFPEGRGRAPQVIAFPDPVGARVVGSFPATLATFFATVDVNYRHKLLCTDNARLDALVGYRFAYLEDQLYLGEVPDGSDDYKRNRASVSNPFHGGQIGLASEVRADGWYASGSAKVAFGVVTPEVTTSGLFVGAEGRTGNGFRRLGALNAADESEFAVIPTLNVAVGRQVGDHSRVFAGYSFQYLSRVARLGDALDPGSGRLTLTDFWVQSINFGVEWRY